MVVGSALERLDGYPFEVCYSSGAYERARSLADVGARAYIYFSQLFLGFEPDIAVVVVNEADWRDWSSRCPYGLPFFNDEFTEVRAGVVVMPAGSGDFWRAIAQDIQDASPKSYQKLIATYPDGTGSVDLQSFFDLITIHELGHAFEVLGNLRLPTFWLGEIFANLALHSFVSMELSASLPTLETLPSVGAQSRELAARMRREGYSTLEELEDHYTGSDNSMDPLNYVWYQHRWMRLVASIYETEGEDALVRFWNCFRTRDYTEMNMSASALEALLSNEVSPILGRAVRDWT